MSTEGRVSAAYPDQRDCAILNYKTLHHNYP